MLDKLTHTLQRASTLARISAAARNLARAPGEEKQAARRALAALLADARGVPMKVGQFLAGNEADDAFASLTSGVEPLPFEEICLEFERALGGPIEDFFDAVDPVGIAASLGQVHRATLPTGEPVAVKVRYPRIAEAVDAELRLARLVPGLGPVRTWGFDLDAYKRVLAEDLHAELDYRGECRRQREFRARMNVSGLVIPQVLEKFSTETLLVQSWEEGVPLEALGDWSEQDRRHAGVILMCTLFQSLFVHGEIHGDPHSGNYRFRRNSAGAPEVVLLDFGCTIPVTETARLALLKLILGAINNDDTDPMGCFQAMGFDAQKLQPIAHLLPALSRILLEPFVSSAPFRLQTWDLRRRVDLLLGDLKWWFRSAGPANLLFLLRAFRGLMMQLDTLGVALPWQPVLLRVVDPALCQKARELILSVQPVAAVPPGGFKSLAQYLRVRVSENGNQVVAVTFPAGQTIFLEELIPEETLARIQAAGIDIADIQARACANGLRPQELFQFDDGDRRYRVWLD